jgi:hypothetical protein
MNEQFLIWADWVLNRPVQVCVSCDVPFLVCHPDAHRCPDCSLIELEHTWAVRVYDLADW